VKKGAFPSENARFKILYLRIQELEKKWDGGFIQNGPFIINHLLLYESQKSSLKIHGI